MIKDIEYIVKNFIFSEAYLLKKRLKRTINKSYEKELNFINRFRDPNKNAIDVGVYRGVYSYKLSKLYKHVYSFEPNSLIFPFLQKNLPKIISNISLYNYALSNESGVARLNMPIRSKSFLKSNYEELYQLGAASIHEKNKFDKFHSIKVERKRLDDVLVGENIGFIKIDVEGHEKEVIAGSKRIINENRPILLVEIEERHSKNKVIDTINYINNLGYLSFFVSRNELVETKNLESFNNINNFIFKSQ